MKTIYFQLRNLNIKRPMPAQDALRMSRDMNSFNAQYFGYD